MSDVSVTLVERFSKLVSEDDRVSHRSVYLRGCGIAVASTYFDKSVEDDSKRLIDIANDMKTENSASYSQAHYVQLFNAITNSEMDKDFISNMMDENGSPGDGASFFDGVAAKVDGGALGDICTKKLDSVVKKVASAMDEYENLVQTLKELEVNGNLNAG
eukprot:GHVH01000524.1.p2 GENE.GHVH01000524.1~~GHVH01000524.1.p2  ORF type:complete len:160 (+),score=36.24 GHVH01000524.1:1830-2309(+)